ncbi:phosphoethanolamine transferase [Escherichia coli]|uniref:phosphoethanolamine transferase n=1 Tax=Escherichia coli TaxID=562 RepID=UPI0018C49BBE|nr:phosphoethanolamine transferase [Escherichia coli]ELF8282503.1 sulfatase-like hydrolase/transferase [Escherichia coli]MBY8665711.1 phosphoethanolamine transferase [Escherichia coli]MBY8674533.1 phosphoethanolamine transferase [Escherichia coli]MBY8751778.1 phosphoethanolamine transferase [Escherichia coli]MCL7079705.1 phosphoethanolamine transferase [Escherichia coli]
MSAGENKAALAFIAIPSLATALLLQLILSFNITIVSTVIFSLFFYFVSLNKTSRLLVFLFSITLSLLLPHAILVGGLLKKSMLDVIVSSSLSEISQYYSSIPLRQIFYSIFLVTFYTFLLFIARKITPPINKKKKIIISILFISLAARIYHEHLDDIKSIWQEYKELNTTTLPHNQWEIYDNHKKYNTYIVVIGESMRRDFMSLYGFKEKTTPFIDGLPKKFISNYIGTAVNTTLSVPRVLAYSDKNGTLKEENNIISLANLAGFKTYWISSQGYTGKYSISTSRIANFADYKYFNSEDDYGLLPSIENALKSPDKKIIFIHIIGSHEHPCDRVRDYGVTYKTDKGKLINCYLSSYNKTDDMIKKIFGMLQKNEKSFSLVYFSDHGLNIVGGNNEFKVYRNDSVKQSYEIPFFISSSDSADTTEINVTRSAYNFFNYFPTWIGVTTNLTPKGYDIFSDTNDTPVVMSYDSKLKPLSSKTDGLTASDIFNK